MSGTHLTTSRINRVLRPLRTKCEKLASSTHSPGVRVTYSTRSRSAPSAHNFIEDAPPLAILQPPEALQSKLQLDPNSRKHLELSRSIYAVRDAFRNIVQVAFGSVSDYDDRRISISLPSSVLGLSALCGVVVGQELANYQDVPRDLDGDEEGSDVEETREEISYTDELYDEVPLHLRKWTLVAHALQLILRLCPHYPTLLACLLDFCLSQKYPYYLIPHCQALTRALLTISLTSPSNPNAVSPLPPPICNTAHASYLVELKMKWCSASFGNERSFVGMLLQALPSNSSEVWTSKAMVKLARDVSNEDFICLIYFATGLAKVLASSRGEKPKSEKDPNARKLDLLMKWCNSILDHLMFTPKVEDNEDVCLAVLDLAFSYFNYRSPFQSPFPDLEDIMTCVLTWCLASLPPSFSNRDLDQMVKILAMSRSSRSVYSPLISRIFSLSSEDEFSVESIDEIRSFAASLRFNHLFGLEIYFIKQTLTHFDKSLVMSWGHEPEFLEIREELVKNLADAEERTLCRDCDDLDHQLSDEMRSADDPSLQSSPPSGSKKRRRVGSSDELCFPVQKQQRCASQTVQRRAKSKSKFRRRDTEIFDDCPYGEPPPTRRLVRKVTYDESDHTPEAEADSQDANEDDGDDGQSAATLSLHSSSSDDLLDLFAFPDTSPVFVRHPKR